MTSASRRADSSDGDGPGAMAMDRMVNRLLRVAVISLPGGAP
jgi:hypothetical protein